MEFLLRRLPWTAKGARMDNRNLRVAADRHVIVDEICLLSVIFWGVALSRASFQANASPSTKRATAPYGYSEASRRGAL